MVCHGHEILVCIVICTCATSLGQVMCSLDTEEFHQTHAHIDDLEDFKYVPCFFLQQYEKALKEITSLKGQLISADQKVFESKEEFAPDSRNNEEYEKVISGLKNSLSALNKELEDCKKAHEIDKKTINKDLKDMETILADANGKIAAEEKRRKTCNEVRETETNKCNADMQVLNKRLTDSGNIVVSQTNKIQTCNKMLDTEKQNCDAKIKDLTKTCIKPVPNVKLTTLSTGSYHFSKDVKMNWSNAKDFCSKNGLQLLSIENDAENNAILEYIKKIGFPNNDKYFMSGTDQGHEGQWYWKSTGQKFTYTAWIPCNPNKLNPPQQCTTIWNNNGRINWDNDYCNINIKFICELPK